MLSDDSGILPATVDKFSLRILFAIFLCLRDDNFPAPDNRTPASQSADRRTHYFVILPLEAVHCRSSLRHGSGPEDTDRLA